MLQQGGGIFHPNAVSDHQRFTSTGAANVNPLQNGMQNFGQQACGGPMHGSLPSHANVPQNNMRPMGSGLEQPGHEGPQSMPQANMFNPAHFQRPMMPPFGAYPHRMFPGMPQQAHHAAAMMDFYRRSMAAHGMNALHPGMPGMPNAPGMPPGMGPPSVGPHGMGGMPTPMGFFGGAPPHMMYPGGGAVLKQPQPSSYVPPRKVRRPPPRSSSGHGGAAQAKKSGKRGSSDADWLESVDNADFIDDDDDTSSADDDDDDYNPRGSSRIRRGRGSSSGRRSPESSMCLRPRRTNQSPVAGDQDGDALSTTTRASRKRARSEDGTSDADWTSDLDDSEIGQRKRRIRKRRTAVKSAEGEDDEEDADSYVSSRKQQPVCILDAPSLTGPVEAGIDRVIGHKDFLLSLTTGQCIPTSNIPSEAPSVVNGNRTEDPVEGFISSSSGEPPIDSVKASIGDQVGEQVDDQAAQTSEAGQGFETSAEPSGQDDEKVEVRKYQIKWVGRAQVHNSLLTLDEVQEMGVNGFKKVTNYIKKIEDFEKRKVFMSDDEVEQLVIQQELQRQLDQDALIPERIVVSTVVQVTQSELNTAEEANKLAAAAARLTYAANAVESGYPSAAQDPAKTSQDTAKNGDLPARSGQDPGGDQINDAASDNVTVENYDGALLGNQNLTVGFTASTAGSNASASSAVGASSAVDGSGVGSLSGANTTYGGLLNSDPSLRGSTSTSNTQPSGMGQHRPVRPESSVGDLSGNDASVPSVPSLLGAAATAIRELAAPERKISQQLYLVKWTCCPYDQCSWETGSLLRALGFGHLIDEYELRQSRISGKLSADHPLNQHDLSETSYEPYVNTPPYIAPGLSLREYQITGVNWIISRMKNDLSVLLADEMGLGKTAQTITTLGHILCVEKIAGPVIVIVPQSTMDNWLAEFKRWLPQANVVLYHGNAQAREVLRRSEMVPTRALPMSEVALKSYHSSRRSKFAPPASSGGVGGSFGYGSSLRYGQPFGQSNSCRIRYKCDVLVTTPSILQCQEDLVHLRSIPWYVMVIDEAHQLKNRESKRFKELCMFRARYKLLLSGTPLHNNLEELWSLLHFMNPSIYANLPSFQMQYSEIEKTSSVGELKAKQLNNLQKELSEVVLRRVKKDVLKALPNKIEMILRVELSPKQQQLCRDVVLRNYESLSKSTGGSKLSLQNICIELKKICNHPFLLHMPENRYELNADLIWSSSKMCLLEKLLERLYEKKNRVLIFSQMVKMLNILSIFLTIKGYKFQRLDGTMNRDVRKKAMDHFNSPTSDDFCFLLSTKAGGLGINLTSADTVIIYDSDWNPQNDLQAEARAHRIGQTKTVQIYRILTKDSIEEDILERAKSKMVLDALVVQQLNTKTHPTNGVGGLIDSSNKNTSFTPEELSRILKFGATKLWKTHAMQSQGGENTGGEGGEAGDGELNIDLERVLAEAERTSEATQGLGRAEDLLSSFQNVSDFRYEAPKADLPSWDNIIPLEERLKLAGEKEPELAKRRIKTRIPKRKGRRGDMVVLEDEIETRDDIDEDVLDDETPDDDTDDNQSTKRRKKTTAAKKKAAKSKQKKPATTSLKGTASSSKGTARTKKKELVQEEKKEN